jgi:hypothetical protein
MKSAGGGRTKDALANDIEYVGYYELSGCVLCVRTSTGDSCHRLEATVRVCLVLLDSDARWPRRAHPHAVFVSR